MFLYYKDMIVDAGLVELEPNRKPLSRSVKAHLEQSAEEADSSVSTAG